MNCDLARNLAGGAEHFRGGQRPARKPDRCCLLAGEVTSCQEEFRCAREADRPRHGPVGVRIGENAAADMREGELSLGRYQADVALHGQRQADADRVAVYRGDHGLPNLPRRKCERIGAELGFVASRECVCAGAEVRPDAKRGARARHDYGAHVVATVAFAIGACERSGHRTREGVPLAWTIERQLGDAVGNRHPQVFVGHCSGSLNAWTRSATASGAVSL